MPDRSGSSTLLPTLALLALALGLGAIFRALGRWHSLNSLVPEFIALALAAGVVYAAGVFLVERYRLGVAALLVILLGAVAIRLAVLPRPPSLSDDTYRYQWEGRVERLGINPYAVSPGTPGLRRLENPAHPLKTGRNVSTLYPPLSEWAFAWVKTIPGYKRLFTGFDLAAIALLLGLLASLKQPLHRVLVYAWNPAVVVSFAISGHHDSLAIATVLAAILLIIHRRPALATALLALSFLAKFFSILLLPLFLLKRARKAYAGLFVAVVALAYLPYIGAGRKLFSGLSDYAAGWEGNDSLFRLIRLAGNSKAQAELVAGVFVLALVALALRQRMEPLRAALFLFAGLLFLSPNAFPWYFTWIVPSLCFYPNAPLLLLTVTCVLGYAPVVAYAAGQPWKESAFMVALEYVPVFAWLAFQAWRSFARQSTAAQSS